MLSNLILEIEYGRKEIGRYMECSKGLITRGRFFRYNKRTVPPLYPLCASTDLTKRSLRQSSNPFKINCADFHEPAHRVTGPNGNSIFLPDCGRKTDEHRNRGYGYYWVSTLYYGASAYCIDLVFKEYYCCDRYAGLSIRPVRVKGK